MIVRILAAIWLATTLWSLLLGIRALTTVSRVDVTTRLTAFTESVANVGRWQFRPSLLLAVALIRAFFTSDVNTALWPWSTVAWVALFLQLLFLRPHLGGYIEIVRRGFERPVERFVLAHAALDVVVAAPLIAIVVNGTT